MKAVINCFFSPLFRRQSTLAVLGRNVTVWPSIIILLRSKKCLKTPTADSGISIDHRDVGIVCASELLTERVHIPFFK